MRVCLFDWVGRLHRSWLAPATLCLLALAVAPLASSAAEYRVAPGDVLELSVVSAPELKQRVEVGVEGTVSFPLIGDIQAAGRPLKDIRAEVQSALSKQPYRRQVSTETGPSVYNIGSGEVSLVIAEFRPVYVSGDVAHPGQVPYRSGMTVRQAVAIAGGYGREREEVDKSGLETKYDQAALDYAKFGLQVRRLEMELGRKPSPDTQLSSGEAEPAITSSMAADEEERRASREQVFNAKKAYLKDSLQQSSGRIAVLENQTKIEQTGADLDATEVSTVDELFHKGVVSASRLTEARRSGLLSSSRALETRIALEDAKRNRLEMQDKLDSLDRDRKNELLQDLEAARPGMRNAALEMQGVRRQMAAHGDVRSGVEVVIFRPGSDAAGGVAADEAAEVFPGDTVEINILKKPKADTELGALLPVK